MTTFSKIKRFSNYQPNCLNINKNNNDDNNNKLTINIYNDVESNLNKDINKHQCIVLTYLYTKKFFVQSLSINKKAY